MNKSIKILLLTVAMILNSEAKTTFGDVAGKAFIGVLGVGSFGCASFIAGTALISIHHTGKKLFHTLKKLFHIKEENRPIDGVINPGKTFLCGAVLCLIPLYFKRKNIYTFFKS